MATINVSVSTKLKPKQQKQNTPADLTTTLRHRGSLSGQLLKPTTTLVHTDVVTTNIKNTPVITTLVQAQTVGSSIKSVVVVTTLSQSQTASATGNSGAEAPVTTLVQTQTISPTIERSRTVTTTLSHNDYVVGYTQTYANIGGNRYQHEDIYP